MTDAKPIPRWAGAVAALGIAVGIGIMVWSDRVDAQHQARAVVQAEQTIIASPSAESIIAAARASRHTLTREQLGTHLIRWVDRHPQVPAQQRILVLLEVKDIATSTSTSGWFYAGKGLMPVGYHLPSIPELTDAANQRLVPLLGQAAQAGGR